MFFRREKPRKLNFDNRLSSLREAGFTVTSEGSGKTRVSKLGCAAILEDRGEDLPQVGKAGVIVGNEIGHLVHGGYQSFFETATRRKIPALAEHLTALHTFTEDLREALGMISLYNTSLGTTYDSHKYDRVADRDVDRPKKPWEVHVREEA